MRVGDWDGIKCTRVIGFVFDVPAYVEHVGLLTRRYALRFSSYPVSTAQRISNSPLLRITLGCSPLIRQQSCSGDFKTKSIQHEVCFTLSIRVFSKTRPLSFLVSLC